MTNLFVIITAKAMLLTLMALWLQLPSRALVAVLSVGLCAGTLFGLIFFFHFYAVLGAIDYQTPVTWQFVVVNATLSYGATAATVALLPIRLELRRPVGRDWRERIYFLFTIATGVAGLALAENQFVRAFCSGVILMSMLEVTAPWFGRSGPIADMLYGRFGPMLRLLAASAGLGVLYETLNLLFPVWDWPSLAPMPPAIRTMLMMGIGYIVLIHPLFVAVRLILPAPTLPRSS